MTPAATADAASPRQRAARPHLAPSSPRFRLLRLVARTVRGRRLPGAARWLRWLHAPARSPVFEAIVPLLGGPLVHVHSDSLIEWELFFHGVHEPHVAAWWPRLVGPGSVTLDVGANVGSHALALARASSPDGLVLAIEPAPHLHERLLDNLRLNPRESVRPVRCALSDSPGRRSLHLPHADSANQMTASLSVTPDRPTVEVECRTLDALVAEEGLERVDLVKIDVEGHELAVLRGARETLERHRPCVVFEAVDAHWRAAGFTFDEAQVLLESLGYTLHVVGPDWLTPIARGRPEWADVLALPPRR